MNWYQLLLKVTKDVRRLRNFEQTLLQNYQLFLTLLDETVRSKLYTCTCSNHQAPFIDSEPVYTIIVFCSLRSLVMGNLCLSNPPQVVLVRRERVVPMREEERDGERERDLWKCWMMTRCSLEKA